MIALLTSFNLGGSITFTMAMAFSFSIILFSSNVRTRAGTAVQKRLREDGLWLLLGL